MVGGGSMDKSCYNVDAHNAVRDPKTVLQERKVSSTGQSPVGTTLGNFLHIGETVGICDQCAPSDAVFRHPGERIVTANQNGGTRQ